MSRVGGLSAKAFLNYCQTILVKPLLYLQKAATVGSSFTGVILSVNDCFVRLITRIGRLRDVPWVMPVRDLTLEISTEKALRLRVVDAV